MFLFIYIWLDILECQLIASIKNLTLRLRIGSRDFFFFFFSSSIAIIQSTIDFVNPRRDLVSGTRARTIGACGGSREKE